MQFPHDGFFLEATREKYVLTGRIEGNPCELQECRESGDHTYSDGDVTLSILESGEIVPQAPLPAAARRVEMGRYHALVTLLGGIVDANRIHPINTPLLSSTEDEME